MVDVPVPDDGTRRTGTGVSCLKLFADAGFGRVTKINPIFQSKCGERRVHVLEP
jgi:hypothetical protein